MKEGQEVEKTSQQVNRPLSRAVVTQLGEVREESGAGRKEALNRWFLQLQNAHGSCAGGCSALPLLVNLGRLHSQRICRALRLQLRVALIFQMYNHIMQYM